MISNIYIYPNEKKDEGLCVTKRAAQILREHGGTLWAEPSYSESALKELCRFAPKEDIIKFADLIITFGGDGTILSAVRDAILIPVLGVNLGRVGFMAELEATEISLLGRVFETDAHIEERMMIDVLLERKGETQTFSALNDACLSATSNSRVVQFELFCDGNHVSHYRADGIIFATPNGSTAYSLSAGGSVCDPGCECICVTPICSHSLINSRPLIFAPERLLTVAGVETRDSDAFITIDGHTTVKLFPADRIKIKRSEKKGKLMRILNRPFHSILYGKF
ncbi:MAG: NAD(+)/NADH kinase [Oscillospiraceae bacterium]|nr:NAD(+)/NADH kinase [Oscillospiraceae bacterium]